MAKLEINGTAFEYIPIEKNELYFISGIKFTLNNRDFINPKLLINDEYSNIYEDVDDGIVEFFKRTLKDDKPDWWECVDDIIEIAVYPREYFPFLSKGREINSVTQDLQTQSKLYNSRGLSDYFTIIIFLRSYYFTKKEYAPNGISLHLLVHREELEKFVQEIEQEKNKIQRLF